MNDFIKCSYVGNVCVCVCVCACVGWYLILSKAIQALDA